MKEIKIELRRIEDVFPYEQNVKIHDDAQIERIAKSISEFGWDQPIVVDASGVIIKGHGRRLAALKLGFDKVPVLIRDDLTEDQVRAARLADNRVALGDINTEILQRELASLNFDLEGIFDKKELDFMSADLSEINIDAVVLDLDAAIRNNESAASESFNKAKDLSVRIDKALGFKEISGRDERSVAFFMSMAEEKTKLKGSDAFISFINTLMEKSA